LHPYYVSIGYSEEYKHIDGVHRESWFPSHYRRKYGKPVSASDVATRLEELYGSRDEALRCLNVTPTVLLTVTDGTHCSAIEWHP
jgi:hypothetical protein